MNGLTGRTLTIAVTLIENVETLATTEATVSRKLVSAPPPASNLVPA